jgi:hypothetical protein
MRTTPAEAARTLHRWRWVLFGVCAVILVVAAFFSWHSARSGSRIAGVLGPTPGPNSAGHIEAQKAYLARAARRDPTKPSGALISLARMTRPSDVEALRPRGRVTAIFVRFPTSQPEALKITTTIADAMNDRAKQLQDVVKAEISGLQRGLKSSSGAQAAQTRSMLAQRENGLRAITGDCACVYALVVEHSTLASLEAEQNKPGVRLVDVPDPPVATLQGWQLTPLLPEGRSG